MHKGNNHKRKRNTQAQQKMKGHAKDMECNVKNVGLLAVCLYARTWWPWKGWNNTRLMMRCSSACQCYYYHMKYTESKSRNSSRTPQIHVQEQRNISSKEHHEVTDALGNAAICDLPQGHLSHRSRNCTPPLVPDKPSRRAPRRMINI